MGRMHEDEDYVSVEGLDELISAGAATGVDSMYIRLTRKFKDP